MELAERAGPIDCLIVVDGAAHGIAVSAGHVEGAAASIVERITAAGGRGAVRIKHGDLRERIPAIAAEGYSMVVVGKHGHDRVTGAVIGTTAACVAEVAGVSVLLVSLNTDHPDDSHRSSRIRPRAGSGRPVEPLDPVQEFPAETVLGRGSCARSRPHAGLVLVSDTRL